MPEQDVDIQPRGADWGADPYVGADSDEYWNDPPEEDA
jgi:hypothetical protein